jgi:hypothetical protein
MAGESKTYADIPWWAALISALLSAGLVFLAMSVKMPAPGAVATPSIGALFTETALFVPHALILFGILADMFTYQGVYSIPSAFGIGSIFINKLLDYFWMGMAAILDRGTRLAQAATGTQQGGSITNYTGCTVQGFDYFKSQYSSQTLVVTATILSYYIFDLAMNKGVASAAASIGMGIALFGLQASSMSSGNCFQETGGMAVTSLISVANGLIIGGLFFGIMEAYAPQMLPSRGISSIPKVNVTDLKVDSASGKLLDSSGKAWSVLPDGTPIPDMCGELMASDVDSTGRPATAGTCPGGAVTAT